MSRLVGLEFGDIVVDNNLSRDDRHHCGVFVKENNNDGMKATVIELTDTRGYFWTVKNNHFSKLEVDKRINFEAYLQDYNEKLKAVANG